MHPIATALVADTPRTSRPPGQDRAEWQDGLVRCYQAEPHARNQIVAELLPIVHAVARRYKRGEEPLEDLIQVGSVGLLKALKRFDSDRGAHFMVFAVPTISGEIRRHYRDTGWAVHVPRGVQELAQRVTAAERDLWASTGRSPTVGDIAHVLGRDEEAVLEAWTASRGLRAVSMDQPRFDDDEDAPDDRHFGAVDDGFAHAEHRATLQALVETLPARDRAILDLRYHEGLSQRQIGNRIGVSQMHVSRLLARIHAQLRTTAAGD